MNCICQRNKGYNNLKRNYFDKYVEYSIKYKNMKKLYIILTLLVSTLVFSQDGELDLSFATNGIYNPTNLNFRGSLLDLSVDESNNIFISGNVVNSDETISIIVLKLLPNGVLDTSFGNNGSARVHYNPTAYVSKNIVLENGKIILVGWISANNNDLLIIGLNADGSLDSNFGDNGRVIMDSGFGDDRAYTIAEYNNALFIGGQLWNQESKSDFSVVKLDLNGNLDSSFGVNGVARLNVPGEKGIIRDLIITDVGDIVACGKVRYNSAPYYAKDDFAIVRFDQNGNIVSEFGDNGLVVFLMDGNQEAFSIKNSENSYYITSSEFNDDVFSNRVIIAKIDNDGMRVPSFGDTGLLSFRADNNYGVYYAGYSSLLQNNNKLIIGGDMRGQNDYGMVYKRINPDGTLDQNFGTDGTIVFDWWSAPDMGNTALSKQFDDTFLSLRLRWEWPFYDDNYLILTRHNIDQSLSINEEEIRNQEYAVYPNPASHELFIKKPTSEPANGILYDITGMLISNFPLKEIENRIDLSNIASGIYFLQISNNENSIVKKIVIE